MKPYLLQAAALAVVLALISGTASGSDEQACTYSLNTWGQFAADDPVKCGPVGWVRPKTSKMTPNPRDKAQCPHGGFVIYSKDGPVTGTVKIRLRGVGVQPVDHRRGSFPISVCALGPEKHKISVSCGDNTFSTARVTSPGIVTTVGVTCG